MDVALAGVCWQLAGATAVKEPTRRTPRSLEAVSGRRNVENQHPTSASNEIMEWLDGVLADPDLARAVEERLAEMRADQRREAARASGRPRQRLSVPPREPVPRGEARRRREASSKAREQAPFVVRTPYPDPSATARHLGMKPEDAARVDDLIESRFGCVTANRRRAKGAPKRRPG